jgi:hypothetical protein
MVLLAFEAMKDCRPTLNAEEREENYAKVIESRRDHQAWSLFYFTADNAGGFPPHN